MRDRPVSSPRRGQQVKVLPLPTLGYSSETSTYGGAVALFMFNFCQDDLTRTSNAKTGFSNTWNKLTKIEAPWNYFFPGRDLVNRRQQHFSKYTDLYYDVGANTPDEHELTFQGNRTIVDVDVLKRIIKHLFPCKGFVT